eukprot:9866677-Alexandrium_andersonii.AAC.1
MSLMSGTMLPPEGVGMGVAMVGNAWRGTSSCICEAVVGLLSTSCAGGGCPRPSPAMCTSWRVARASRS